MLWAGMSREPPRSANFRFALSNGVEHCPLIGVQKFHAGSHLLDLRVGSRHWNGCVSSGGNLDSAGRSGIPSGYRPDEMEEGPGAFVFDIGTADTQT